MTAGNHHFQFLPALTPEYRGAVEALFFFNPRQWIVRDGIRASVDRHGVPEIMERDGRIWIGVSSGTTQCLFACDRRLEPPRLAGVVVYSRPMPETLCITHLAVDPEYASDGGNGCEGGLGLILFMAVRQLARRMKGVVHLQLPYRSRCYLPVSE